VSAEAQSDPLLDSARIEALESTGLLGTPPEPSFDRLARLATDLVGAPIGVISLIAEDHLFFKSLIGIQGEIAGERTGTLGHSFCRRTLDAGAPVVIEDAAGDPQGKDSAAVAELGIAAYAGFPVRAPNGQILGALAVADRTPRCWDSRDLEGLREIAAAVSSEIHLRHALAALERERRCPGERNPPSTDHRKPVRSGLDLQLRFPNGSLRESPGGGRLGDSPAGAL